MSPPSGIRGPSQITGFPSALRRWELRSTGFGPLAVQGWLPVFVTVIWIVLDSPQYAEASPVLVNPAA
jgi:hypothetical protein